MQDSEVPIRDIDNNERPVFDIEIILASSQLSEAGVPPSNDLVVVDEIP